MDLSLALLNQIETISMMAGKAIMEIYQKDFQVDFKQDKSPLTEADQVANRIILSELRKRFPETPILSEESSEYFQQHDTAKQYFLVDPLDGTKEFIKKNDEFTVNIALIQNGESVLGVVYAPALHVLFSACKRLGAFRIRENQRQSIQVKPQQTPVRILVSRSHLDAKTEQFISKFDLSQSTPLGSSLKMCHIAAGDADLYPRFGPTSLWDTAAAQAILEEAGGMMVKLDGERLSYANPRQVLNEEFIATSLEWSLVLDKLKNN